MEENKIKSDDIFEDLAGCFFSIDFENLNLEDKKKLLISKNIYEIEDLQFNLNLPNHGDQNDKEENIIIGQNFVFLGKNYCLGERFLKQVYEYVQMNVFIDTEHLTKIRITDIQAHAKHVETFGNVSDFYKEIYEQHYDEIKKDENFLTYNDPEVWHYIDWEYFVTDCIRSDCKLIEAYLFEDYVNTSKYEICKSWENLHYHTEILNYLKSKLVKNQVPNQGLKILKSTLSMKIFIDDGEEIFNYILKVYEDQLNPSFFSYLYDFLNTKLHKIRTKGLDSKKYRDYVEEITKIKMSRIIYSDVNYSEEKSSMFELFNIYFSDYLELKKMNNT